MGPDCGTAGVGGVGLGFANVVRPGPVGIVAASGTGAQQLMCLLDAAGVGVSHCLGVGGRDLSAAVGGRSTRQALRALDDDPATEPIVVVSKPPARRWSPTSRRRRRAGPAGALGAARRRADRTSPTAVEAVLAAEGPACRPGRPRARGCRTTAALAAGLACAACSPAARCPTRRWSSRRRARRHPVQHPARARPGARAGPATDAGHVMIDFGDDALTHGRAHPMIDPTAAPRAHRRRGRRPDVRRRCCSTSCSATAPTPTRPPSWRRRSGGRRARADAAAGAAGRRLAVRHRRRPAGPRRGRRGARRRRRLGLPVQRAAPGTRSPPREPAMTSEPTPVSRPLRGLLETDPVVGRPGSTCSPTRCATRRCRSPRSTGGRRWSGTEARPRPACWPTRAVPRPTPPARRRMLAAGAELVDVLPAREALGLRARHVPARRPADRPGSAPPARCAAR